MNEQQIFLAALEIADPAKRAAYLQQACQGDAALQQQVKDLLAAHEQSGEFLQVPALRQVAGSVPFQANPAETSAEARDAMQEINLSFLQPSTAPGSLGRLGHYEIREVIGRGGCGIVLKAFDETLHRVVAIKVMAPELALTSPARKRFLREARAAAAIRHENVISIYAVEDQPIPFLVMEYIAGPTLQEKLDQSGPLDVPEVVRIGQQIASGLEAAHAMGLIHRDIKPGNILLERGRDQVKITDFGLARASDDASLTQTGVIAGTPLYMSPEQARGDVVDPRSDLFSLGSVLYVMCSGRPPFRASTTLAVLKRVADDEPRPIQEIIPEVPQWLSTLIARLHAKKPTERCASAHEVASLLGQSRAEVSSPNIMPPKPTAAEALKPTVKRPESSAGSYRWLATAATLLIAMLIGLSLTEAAGVTNFRGTVVRLLSTEGTLVIEVDDPSISVSIDGEELVITGAGIKEIRVKPGQHKILASKNGELVQQELVTVTRNGRKVVRVSQELQAAVASGKLPTAGQLPTGDSPPAKDAFAGKLIFHDTFEDPKSSSLFQGERDGGRFSVENGAYNLDVVATKAPTLLTADIGPATVDMGFATRMRVENSITQIVFRIIVSKTRGNWLLVRITPAGRWSVLRNDMEYPEGKRVDKLTILAESVQDDPDLAAGKWVNIAGRTQGNEYEVWVNGKSVARGINTPDLREPNECKSSVQFACITDGLAKVAVDYAAVWDLTDTVAANRGPTRAPAYSNSLGMEFALIPKGKAWLGGSAGRLGEREVEYKDNFYLGVYEVTQEEWEKVMGKNPSAFAAQGSLKEDVKDIPAADLKRFPVETVSWDDAQLFVKKLNEQAGEPGWIYRLPLEAEWEYASRGGPMTDKGESGFQFTLEKPTNQLRASQANINNELKRTCKVGSYAPNPLGLYDMHGNVWEWSGDDTGKGFRWALGACFASATELASAANRGSSVPAVRFEHHGLRVARVPVSADPDRKAAEYVLSINGTLFINDQSNRITAIADLPKDAFRLTAIDLILNNQVTDTGLAHFRDCKHLVWVSLDATGISNAGLRHFEGLQSLRGVALNSTTITDEGLAHLKDCPNLKQLYLLGCSKVTDAGFAHFQNCRGWEKLGLGGTQLSNKGLLYFQELDNLWDVDISNTRVTDEGLAHFSDCRNIQHLYLGQLAITETGAAYFRNNKRLVTLTLNGTPVNEAFLAHFRGCQRLTHLDLNFTPVTDAELAPFKGSNQLTKLFLMATPVGDAGLANFKDCTGLEQLALGGCTKVTDEGLAHFTECKNLTLVNVIGTKVTNTGLAALKDCLKLTDLQLGSTKVTDDGLVHCKNYKFLWKILLDDCNVGDAGLAHLKGCEALTSLLLRKTNVTAAGVNDLHKALPKCKIEWDQGMLGPVTNADPDRKAAEYVLLLGGSVRVNGRVSQPIDKLGDLPSEAFQLTGVLLNGETLADNPGLAHFRECKHLTLLSLGHKQVSEAALAHFQNCTTLNVLGLSNTNLDDAGLAHFKACTKLVSLELARTSVTDAGLQHLSACSKLEKLSVKNTKVTEAALKKLAAALPRCQITWDGETIEARPER